MNIQIFDNGGKTVDRYCLVVDNRKVYTMAADPLDARGIRYLCDVIDLDRTEAGQSIKLADLPKTVIEAIDKSGSAWLKKEAA